MGRPRKNPEQGLPKRTYLKHGSYFYVHAGTPTRWENLGADLRKARKIAEDYNSGTASMNTLSYWLDAWLRDAVEPSVRRGNLASRTGDDYKKNVSVLKEYFGDMSPKSLQASHVSDYLELGREMGRPVRANREKAALSVALSWMVEKSHAGLVHNVAKSVPRNPEAKRARYITDDEYAMVYEAALPSVRAWLELMYRTLQRPSDILLWTHSNLVKSGGLTLLEFIQSKTKARLRIAVTPTLQSCFDAMAKARKKPSLYLVCREDGLPYTESGISSMARGTIKKLKIADFAPYDCKAKGATDLYAGGTPIAQIQALCGHDSVTTTEKYIKQHSLPAVVQPNERQVKRSA